MTPTNIQKLFLITGLAFAISALTGCQSAHEPGGTSHASVQINGQPLQKIQETAAVVFGEEGYSIGLNSPAQMNFERPGSRRDAAKWGGLMGDGVTMVVKVTFREVAGGNYLLQADAYARQNASDPFFESESRNLRLNRLPYQNLLNEINKRLKTP